MPNAVIPDDTIRGIFSKRIGHSLLSPFSIAALISAYTECDAWLEQMCALCGGNFETAIAFWLSICEGKSAKARGNLYSLAGLFAYGLTAEEIHSRVYESCKCAASGWTGSRSGPKGGQFPAKVCAVRPRSHVGRAP